MRLRRQSRWTRALIILAAAGLSTGCAGRAGPLRPASEASSRSQAEERRARVERAYQQIRLKRWEDVFVLLNELLAEDPGDKRLRMERGYARQASGNLAAAADDFGVVAREPSALQEQAQAALAVIAAQSAPAAREQASTALLNEGYDALRRGETQSARYLFRKALSLDPGNTAISKQLGYMAIAEGDLAAAAREFAGIRRIAPTNYSAALELGYLYDSLNDNAGAKASFAAALPSPDKRTRKAAASALDVLHGKTDPLYLDLYAAPLYTSRFSNKIAYFEAQLGYRPVWSGPVSFFLGSRYTQDSRSRSGTAPDIYSDNYAALASGIRFAPEDLSASLSAEWGGDINLLRSSEHPRLAETNWRVIVADYHYWAGPKRSFVELGASAGYYSRYRDNLIGYLQFRGGLTVWDKYSSRLSVYAPINVLKDRNRDFFNNIVEAGGGLEFQPSTKASLKLRAEYLLGSYMGIEGRDRNPYAPRYRDLRALLIFSRHFSRRPAPERPAPKRKRVYPWSP